MSYNNKLQHIECLRREYTKSGLRRYNLPKEPLVLFENWLEQACAAKLIDPTAMIMATVDKYGQPWQRIVLLKHYDHNGLVFYTNLNSCKAHHIKFNSCVSLLFPWHMLERQVIVTGTAEHVSVLDAVKYFQKRPRSSQISALVSKQSSLITGRKVLENKFLELQQKFQNSMIQSPNFWGGFCISIKQIEFWQGGKYRLHDRFVYRREGKSWNIYRLAP